MGKFFIKKPEKCSICGQEKMIHKQLRQGLTNFKYCRNCYDDYYKKIEGRVLKQVQESIKSGQQIGMKEALAITKEVTNEIDNETNTMIFDDTK